jgi:nanoRNase/pAp phosphatase (c-di-AMP/oligoRNAs hydrolase)/CBS domain-containing protein
MIVVTTHNNTDFDALASMVAASLLYPQALRVIPRQVQPPVREFLAVHWDLLRLCSRKSIDLDSIDHLIVTDTASWQRLDNMEELAGRNDVSCIVFDHHPAPGTIAAEEIQQEEVGAAVTLLLERLQVADTPFSPMHATLFLLGIYDDTGSLSFPSTTARDVRMAAFLMENGADLNVVSAYLDDTLDERHLELFSRMLGESESLQVGSLRFGICVQDADKGLTMLPTVVSKFKEIRGLDAAFGVFPMGPQKTVVIGRGNPRLFDVGAVVRKLGGGGHAGAGSAMVGAPLAEVRLQVTELLQRTDIEETSVRTLMATDAPVLETTATVRQAIDRLRDTERQALLIVDDERRVLGSFSRQQVARIKQERQLEQTVTGMMRGQVPSVTPDQPLRDALQLMARSELGFLPVLEDGRFLGEITRAAIILNMYDF